MFFEASGVTYLVCVSILCGQYAVMQLLFLSMINIHVSVSLRGTAIGVFYCAIGAAYMIATNISGFLCQNFGYTSAFFFAFLISVVSM